MIVPVMAISNLVLTRQIYSDETNGAHPHYREPVPLNVLLFSFNFSLELGRFLLEIILQQYKISRIYQELTLKKYCTKN